MSQRDRYGVRRVARFEFFVYGHQVMSGSLRGDVEERRDLTMIIALCGGAQY